MDSKKRLILEIIAQNKAKAALAGANRDVTRFTGNVKRMASSMMAMAGVGGLGYMLRDSIRDYAEFSKGIANVSTMLDEQSMHHLPQYSKQVRQLAMDMGKDVGTLNDGLYKILSASVAPEKAISALAISSKAATAGITDVGITANTGAGIINAYGADVGRLNRVYDILFATVKRGQTDFGLLAPVIGQVTAIGSQAGQELEQLSAAISTITRQNIPTDKAITGLSQAMIVLQGSSTGAIKLAKEHGIELSVQALKTQGLIGMIRQLSALNPEVLKDLISEKRARIAINALLNDQAGFVKDYELALNSSGMMQEAYSKQTGSLSHEIDKLKASAKDLKIGLGETFGPTLVRALSIVIDSFREMGSILGVIEEQLKTNFKESIINDVKTRDIQQVYRDITGDTKAFTQKPSGYGRWAPPDYYKPQDKDAWDLLQNNYPAMHRRMQAGEKVNPYLERLLNSAEFSEASSISTVSNIPGIEPFLPKGAARKIETEEIVDVNEKLINKVLASTAAMERQAAVIDMLTTHQGESVKMAQFRVLAEEAYTGKADEATKAVEKYAVALSKVEAAAQAEKIKSLSDALSEQTKVYELINNKEAENLQIAGFMIQAQKAYGEGTTAVTDAVNRYRTATEKLTAAQEKQAAAAKAIEDQQRAAQDTERIIGAMRRELDMVGQISRTWERSRENEELHAAAILEAAGNVDIYNARMAEGADLFEQLKMAEKWDEVAKSMEGSFSSAIEKMMFEGEKFGNVMVSVLREIAMEMTRVMLIRDVSQSLAGGLSGFLGGIFGGSGGAAAASSGPGNLETIRAGAMHNGGVVGIDRGSPRTVPASMFDFAPRLHGGLRGDEYPAILQRGETVIPKSGGGGGVMQVTINHTNNGTSQQLDIRRAIVDNKDMILDIVSWDGEHDGQITRMVEAVG